MYNFYCNVFFYQQTETVDIGTCDQAVPKTYTDKGIIEFFDLIIVKFWHLKEPLVSFYLLYFWCSIGLNFHLYFRWGN